MLAEVRPAPNQLFPPGAPVFLVTFFSERLSKAGKHLVLKIARIRLGQRVKARQLLVMGEPFAEDESEFSFGWLKVHHGPAQVLGRPGRGQPDLLQLFRR